MGPGCTTSDRDVRFDLTDRKVVAHAAPASIYVQASRHKSAQAADTATMEDRTRWLTPSSTKLLSVTDWAGDRRDAQEHEESEQFCTFNFLHRQTAACPKLSQPRRDRSLNEATSEQSTNWAPALCRKQCW